MRSEELIAIGRKVLLTRRLSNRRSDKFEGHASANPSHHEETDSFQAVSDVDYKALAIPSFCLRIRRLRRRNAGITCQVRL